MRDWHSEADVAAEFAHRLKCDGRLAVLLEVEMPSRHHRSGTFRADGVVVHPDDRVVCAVEFKREGKKVNHVGRQWNAYNDCGMPYVLCHGMSHVEITVEKVYGLAGLRPPTGHCAVGRVG